MHTDTTVVLMTNNKYIYCVNAEQQRSSNSSSFPSFLYLFISWYKFSCKCRYSRQVSVVLILRVSLPNVPCTSHPAASFHLPAVGFASAVQATTTNQSLQCSNKGGNPTRTRLIVFNRGAAHSINLYEVSDLFGTVQTTLSDLTFLLPLHSS